MRDGPEHGFNTEPMNGRAARLETLGLPVYDPCGGDSMKRATVALFVFAFVGVASVVRADDKADPTGTWKWTVTAQNGQARETTLKLKLDGDKLTGAVVGRNNQETKIDDGKFKDGQVSFSITRERNGQKFTTKYTGKVSKDSIKGKTEIERDGKTQARDWEAKRAKD
jgi:hypothetical protein